MDLKVGVDVLQNGRTWAEINISALLHNLNLIKAKANGASVVAVVKADAYGHAVDIVLPALIKAGVKNFAVSNIDEALFLRTLAKDEEIIVLGYTPVALAKKLADNNITQALLSKDYSLSLSKFAIEQGVTVNCHIAFDSGMSRVGFLCNQNGLAEALSVSNLNGINICGAFTHFASADSALPDDVEFTKNQYKSFVYATDFLKSNGVKLGTVHCGNSAAILVGGYCMDAVRAGIILYGLNPDESVAVDDLKPVMSLKSVVSVVKNIEKGDAVSYGRTFVADKKMKIATVSAGYADGYPRALSNKGRVYINGKFAPVIGRVCMDQFMVDVSDIASVKYGDIAELMGEHITADEIAKHCGTINYEIVCGISKRVPRIKIN